METNKLMLACLITLCSLPVAAQVKLGIEAGANLSNYITDSHSTPSDSKNMKVGFQAGLTVDYEFQNHLMLMSGLFFVRKGGNCLLYTSRARRSRRAWQAERGVRMPMSRHNRLPRNILPLPLSRPRCGDVSKRQTSACSTSPTA